MRFQSLEAFRGLAAIFVILYHSFFTTEAFSLFRQHSYLFVDFFFILSGFIISYAYLDRIKNKTVTQKTFLLKRIFRLYPLHLFLLFIWLGYILLKHVAFTHHIGGKDPFVTHSVLSFIEHLFLVQAWGTGNIMTWNVPSWSVSVEMMAYVLFLVFTLILHKLSKKKLAFFAFLLVLLFKATLYSNLQSIENFKFLLNGLSAFFIGMIVYILYDSQQDINISAKFSSIMEIVLISTIFFILNSTDANMPFFVIGLQIIFALTIYAFAIQEKGIVSKILHLKPLQYLGLLSYSIYMIHAIIVEITGHFFEYILHFPTTFVGKSKILVSDYANVINISMIIIVIFIAHYTYIYIEQAARRKLNAKL